MMTMTTYIPIAAAICAAAFELWGAWSGLATAALLIVNWGVISAITRYTRRRARR